MYIRVQVHMLTHNTGALINVDFIFLFMWTPEVFNLIYIKLIKGKALRKHSLHEKTAASVLLKLFISGNEWCHTTDAPSAWAELHFQM